MSCENNYKNIENASKNDDINATTIKSPGKDLASIPAENDNSEPVISPLGTNPLLAPPPPPLLLPTRGGSGGHQRRASTHANEKILEADIIVVGAGSSGSVNGKPFLQVPTGAQLLSYNKPR